MLKKKEDHSFGIIVASKGSGKSKLTPKQIKELEDRRKKRLDEHVSEIVKKKK